MCTMVSLYLVRLVVVVIVLVVVVVVVVVVVLGVCVCVFVCLGFFLLSWFPTLCLPFVLFFCFF